MKTKSILLFTATCLAVSLITGCRTFTRPARIKEVSKTAVWMDFDATRRGGLLLGTNGNYQLVMEPAPDVAITSLAEFVTKANIKGEITAEQTTRISESLTALGKRTAALMMLRESLFRLNQLAAAGTIKDAAVTNLFGQIINVASELAKAEVAAEAARPKVEEESANKAKANAQAEVAKAGTKTKQLEILSEQLQQIHKLDVPAAEKANMLQRLRPPTE